ncbi:MAG: glycosyl transferase, partial [Cyclobacteriaceae bacterium]|nr:glycosyl transferase [Cyclobacteriaceae bacterium]
RIEKQVRAFQQLPEDYGTIYTDAEYIDEKGEVFKKHKDYLLKKGLVSGMYEGDVFSKVLSTFFIASPTMMSKRKVYEELEGYNEKLSYEDFDFWVRSSRNWKYKYLDEPLTGIRKLKSSMSANWYEKEGDKIYSTYSVCKAVQALIRNEEEQNALVKRIKYEYRQCVFTGNIRVAAYFYTMMQEYGALTPVYRALNTFQFLHPFYTKLRRLYYRMRYF